jgi:hypothetical protein
MKNLCFRRVGIGSMPHHFSECGIGGQAMASLSHPFVPTSPRWHGGSARSRHEARQTVSAESEPNRPRPIGRGRHGGTPPDMTKEAGRLKLVGRPGAPSTRWRPRARLVARHPIGGSTRSARSAGRTDLLFDSGLPVRGAAHAASPRPGDRFCRVPLPLGPVYRSISLPAMASVTGAKLG